MYNNDAQRCLTGEVRLSYANLDKPRQPQGGVGDAKYSATLLIPKTDTATIADFRAAIQAAAQVGAGTLWGGIVPPNLDSIIHDGDGVRPSGIPFGDECHGCWVITASSKNKPQVVGQDNINVELAPQDIYSGMYARVTVRFYPFNTAGKRGVGCGLGNVMKTRDGEPLSAVHLPHLISPVSAMPWLPLPLLCSRAGRRQTLCRLPLRLCPRTSSLTPRLPRTRHRGTALHRCMLLAAL